MSYQKDASFSRLLAKEQSFFAQAFLSPVDNCPITVCLEGVVLTMKVEPPDFQGWGVFNTSNGTTASLLRTAVKSEKAAYIKLFPTLSFMICEVGEKVYGVQIQDGNISLDGLVPIGLCEEVRLFDVVYGCCVGNQVWFYKTSRRYPRAIIRGLRDSLVNHVAPDKLAISGISQKERNAYSLVYNRQQPSEEQLIERAVVRARGVFQGFTKATDGYMVHYMVDGQDYTSHVTDNLHVTSAGICLNGTDGMFDLQSLVGVIREGQNSGQIYRVGVR